MNEMSYYEYYNEMNKHSIDLAFKGPFSHEILLSLGDTLLGTISKEDGSDKIPKRVFAIFVELTQNIRDYSTEKKIYNDKTVGLGLIVLREKPDSFTILSGNMIKKEEVASISEYIEKLNGLDKDGLKKLYKKLIAQECKNCNGGVGLITIARKSGQKFDYSFEDVDENNSFFVLSITVKKESANG